MFFLVCRKWITAHHKQCWLVIAHINQHDNKSSWAPTNTFHCIAIRKRNERILSSAVFTVQLGTPTFLVSLLRTTGMRFSIFLFSTSTGIYGASRYFVKAWVHMSTRYDPLYNLFIDGASSNKINNYRSYFVCRSSDLSLFIITTVTKRDHQSSEIFKTLNYVRWKYHQRL